MDKLKALSKIRTLYREGRNLMEFLRSGEKFNDPESIMISYDFQAGSYIQNASENGVYFERYTQMIHAEMTALEPFSSIRKCLLGGYGNIAAYEKTGFRKEAPEICF
jgi:hypothetical protein